MFKKSFTLIELIVVVGILILLTVGSIAGISASRGRRQVKTTADKLKSLLTEARSMAMAPEDTDFGLQSIQVRIYTDPNNNRVELYKMTSATDGAVIPNKNLIVSGDVKIDKCPATNCVGITNSIQENSAHHYYYFGFNATSSSNLGQLTTPGDDNVYIQVSNQSESVFYIIVIDKIGGIATVLGENIKPEPEAPRVGATDWLSPQTVANDLSSVFGTPWTIPDDTAVKDSDNIYAAATMLPSSGVSSPLKATNFSFRVPTDPTVRVVGIRVEVEAHQDITQYGEIKIINVQLYKAGNLVGENKAGPDGKFGLPEDIDIYTPYGGASDTWGTSWNPGDINDPGFGVAFRVQAWADAPCWVDHIRIKVYYTY